MKKGFLKKNKIFSINLLYLLSLIPIIIFAFYKNGLVVYKAGELNLFLSLQYIVIPIIIVVLSYVFETYYYLTIKKDDDLNNVINSIVPYANVLCYLVCGPMNKLFITIPILVVLDVALKFFEQKVTINRVALYKCLIFLVLMALSMNTNQNYYEYTLKSQVDNPGSLFLGMGIGEIGTTSTLFAIVGYLVLLFNKYYKKEIPIICFVSYLLVGLLLYFAGVVSFNGLLINTFNSGFVFAIVFVATLSTATPVVKSGKIIYSLLIGIVSAIFINLVKFNLGIYITILVLGLVSPLLNKIKLSIG
mgnify:FL=1